MNDMTQVIIPKSDQLNSDDLIGGPRTIKITGVEIRPGTEQPVSIRFEGDNGKPWKTCKSMNRVLVAVWGPDAKNYVGRSVTIYRDASVKWGGMEVGGIRISHMSHIDEAQTFALTMTKGSRKPFTVRPLVVSEDAPPPPKKTMTPEQWANAQIKALRAFTTEDAFTEWLGKNGAALAKLKQSDESTWATLNEIVSEVRTKLVGDLD